MNVPVWVWLATIAVAVVFLVIDVVIIARNPHRPSAKETSIALTFYIGLAIAFGIGVWQTAGSKYAGEYFAGWLTEYSLSIDNLFIFLLIMARFKVTERLRRGRGHRAVQLGVLPLRRLPHLHRVQARERRRERR